MSRSQSGDELSEKPAPPQVLAETPAEHARSSADTTATATRSLIDYAPAILAAITALLLCISIIYNNAYFSRINDELFTLLNTDDHLTSCIEWLPFVLLLLAVGWMMGYVITAFATRKVAQIPEWSPERLEALKRLFHWFNRARELCGLVGFLWFMISPYEPFSGIIFVAILLIPPMDPEVLNDMLRGGSSSSNRIKAIAKWRLRYFLGIVGFLVVLSFERGLNAAYDDLRGVSSTLIANREEKEREAILMRSIDKGVLLRFPETNQIVFIDWEGVERFWFVTPSIDNRPRAVVLLERLRTKLTLGSPTG